MPSFSMSWQIDRDEGEDVQSIDLLLEGEIEAYVPAQTCGPPEACSPAEGGAVETLTAYLDGKEFALTDLERQQAIEYVEQNFDHDGAGQPDPDWERDMREDR